MASTDSIKKEFAKIGGVFLTPPNKLAAKINSIKAFVFDWDGVFNNGQKGEQGTSIFSEVDSMGTNLLRFGFWMKTAKMPFTAVISGEKNSAAFFWTNREHFHASYYKIAKKTDALQHFCDANNLKLSEVCYVFDDVLDFSMAEKVGVRIYVKRKENPLLNKYVVKNKLADYSTGASSGNYAVRETCELILGLKGIYESVIKERMHYTTLYENYAAERNKIQTHFFTRSEGKIVENNP